MFEACPKLRFIHCFTAGHELIDLDEAERRGVPVSSGLGTNADSVADQALALALGVLRDVPRYDREIRDSRWKASRTQPQFTGKKVGILGMGRIGREIAQRAAGFRTQIFYAATAPKPDLAWTFCPSAAALAAAVDVLFVACSGGDSTFHLVNRQVLAALGPKGILVNVARGTVVDIDALADALQRRVENRYGLAHAPAFAQRDAFFDAPRESGGVRAGEPCEDAEQIAKNVHEAQP